MLRLGPGALSDAEVLAILLGTGSLNQTALEMARGILATSQEKYGKSLQFLMDDTVEELSQIKGVGPAKVARLKAAVELGKRLQRGKRVWDNQITVRRGKEVFDYVRDDLESLDREHFCILLLNSRNQITGKETVSIGSLDASIVHPREIFKNCIKKSAAAIILVHNHPSGDPSPSHDDLEVTRRLVDAGKLLGIHVLDHVIVARGGRFVSLRESWSGWFA